MPPLLCANGGICAPCTPPATTDLIMESSAIGQIDGLLQRNRRAAFAVRAMTAGAVLLIKNLEIQNLLGANDLLARTRPPGQIIASGQSREQRK